MSGKKTSALLSCFLPFAFSLFVSACLSDGAAGVGAGLVRGGQPEWVRDPYTKYSRQENVAAVGRGNSREAAEKSALGSLVAIFGQSVQVDERVSMSYREAAEEGVKAAWSENTGIDTGITTSASLDSLVGAEIGDVWNDGRGGYYAAAVLNKAKASRIYSDMIDSSLRLIDSAIDIPPGEKNTFYGLARYQFAAAVADLTVPYVNLLSVIGGLTRDIKRGGDYRLEALEISKAIPVGITVRNDRAGRIEGAFAKALAELGFASGGTNSGGNTSGENPPYTLEVSVRVTPVEIVNNQNKFARVELAANLKDSKLGTVLLPFNFNSREGHITQAEAENRAYSAAERKINEEYADFFSGYLSQLLPKN